MLHLRKSNLRVCFIPLVHYITPKYSSTTAWPESLPEFKFERVEVPTELLNHIAALQRYTNDIQTGFYNYSVKVFRQLERAHTLNEYEHQQKLKVLIAELLKATNRFNVRGAIEYIREYIRDHHNDVKSKEPFGQLLDKDSVFKKQFYQAAEDNKLARKDVRESLVKLYHNFSKHAHGTNTADNIIIDGTVLVPAEQFALGALFTKYSVPFKYTNKEGQFAEFPYIMKSINPV